jgi:hypothetical protein
VKAHKVGNKTMRGDDLLIFSGIAEHFQKKQKYIKTMVYNREDHLTGFLGLVFFCFNRGIRSCAPLD